MSHEELMKLALEEARQAALEGEVPVGAVLAREGQVIARAHNLREQRSDPTAHAELLCIRQAAELLHTRRLNDLTLYVTLEPCPMCAGAMMMAQLERCFFGRPGSAAGLLRKRAGADAGSRLLPPGALRGRPDGGRSPDASSGFFRKTPYRRQTP